MNTFKKLLLLGIGTLAFASCNNDDDESNIDDDVTYVVTFTGTWDSTSHPTDFPDNDHFSPAIGMVHKEGVSFFKEGELASEGMEDMAETGGTDILNAEIDQLEDDTDLIEDEFVAGGLPTGTSSTTFEIEVSKEYPLVTVVSMIAPSPDWFVAVENVALYENGTFLDSLTVETEAYDAGTDSGFNFTSPNDDTNPAENIAKITSAPLGNGSAVTPSMAKFTFKRK